MWESWVCAKIEKFISKSWIKEQLTHCGNQKGCELNDLKAKERPEMMS